jgi:uncharacterized iron-regulated protein
MRVSGARSAGHARLHACFAALVGLGIAGLVFSASAKADCAGEIIRVADGRPVDAERLVNEIPARMRLVLGERHGIAAHPVAASCLLAKLSELGATALVLEHLRKDQQEVVDVYRAAHPEIAAGLGARLKWWESGWPAWKNYQILFETAWQYRAPLMGGDLAREAPGTVPASDERLAPELVAGWGEAMGEAYCGLADAAKKKELGILQVRRDIAMAAAMRDADAPVAILFAGRSHARKDRGVPRHLAKSGIPVIAIALQEIRDGRGETDRHAVLAEARGVYDFVWFTGETSERPVCDRLRAKGLVR